jgi:phosphate-selective porin OprO/OprP
MDIVHSMLAVRTGHVAAIALAGCLGLWQPSVWAADEDLLDLLRDKGIITEEEHKALVERRRAKAAAAAREQEKAAAKPAEAAPAPKAAEAPAAPKPEEPPVAAPSEVGGRFVDGVIWESADKRNSLRLSGRVEADYRNFLGDDALSADTFDIRRAYLGASGKFWDHYEFQVVADFAGQSGIPPQQSSLDEAWLTLSWWKQARFRFGQFDTPFSLDTLMSDRFTDFMERSMGSTSLAQGKSRGALVFGTPYTGVYYGLSLTNISGKNTNDTNTTSDSKDVTGRLAVNFAELLAAPRAVYHLGGAFSSGEMPPGSSAPSARTDARGVTFFTPSTFSGSEVDRQRRGLEGILARGPLKLQGEYMTGGFSGTSAAGVAYDRDITSYYVDLNWLITGEEYASAYSGGVLGRLHPKQNFSWKGGGWGAWEVGLGYDIWDASDFPILAVGAANPGTGVLIPTTTSVPSNKASSWILGLKWILNPNTRFLLQYTRTDFATPVTVTSPVTTTSDVEEAVTFRAQIDF